LNAFGAILRVCAQTYPQFLWILTASFADRVEDNDLLRSNQINVNFVED
jgi:hypothetical protein